jgi:hypothetical protein
MKSKQGRSSTISKMIIKKNNADVLNLLPYNCKCRNTKKNILGVPDPTYGTRV